MPRSVFSQEFQARWSDLDSNAHLANTAYLEYAIQCRMAYFHTHGFSPTEFARQGFGPVIFREEIVYLAEIRLMEKFRVELRLGEMTPDGARYTLLNDIYKEDGRPAARLRTEAAWLDLRTRKLIAPPDKVRELLARGEEAAA
ncbi:MAG: thioesterase family protein [Deltaproteobacteria bacterium]|nr:thioesterase family protein [Deltaproteobacteria bacterium]